MTLVGYEMVWRSAERRDRRRREREEIAKRLGHFGKDSTDGVDSERDGER